MSELLRRPTAERGRPVPCRPADPAGVTLSTMPFPRKLLNEGEQVVVDVRPHVWMLAGPIALLALVVAGSVAAAAIGVPAVVAWILVGLLALALVHLLARYVVWRTTSLVVTNLRLVHRSGVIARRGREIPLAQLSDIFYRQGLWDRLIRAGDLVLESAGRDSDEVIPAVPRPATVQNEIYGLLAARQPAPVVTAGLSLPEQLEKLDELRRRGVIDDAEFATTKARLLGGG